MSDAVQMGLFPLDMVILPGEPAGMHLFEPRYRQLFADCSLEDRPFVLVRQVDEHQSPIGCTARFETVEKRFADGRLSVVVRGIEPVEIGDETDGSLYFTALVTPVEDELEAEHQDLRESAAAAYRAFTEAAIGETREPPTPEGIPASYAMAGTIDLSNDAKQKMLETRRESERLKQLISLIHDATQGADQARIAAERAPTNGKVKH